MTILLPAGVRFVYGSSEESKYLTFVSCHEENQGYFLRD